VVWHPSLLSFLPSHDQLPSAAEISVPNSSKAVEDAQSQIDQEIDALEATIRTLKRRRNAVSFVSRLPPEVLSNVFRLTRTIMQLQDSDRQYSLAWIRVTHVCWHWRTVAINCPDLWNRVVIPLEQGWLEEILRRSKKTPLFIIADVRLFPRDGVQEFRTLWLHISRVRELDVSTLGTFGSSTWSRDCLPEHPTPAPMLETFKLSHVELIAEKQFPDDFFQGDVPALRQLTVMNFPVNWESPSFKQLVQLTVSFSSWDNRVAPSMRQMLDFLGNLPNLEILELQHAFPVVDVPAVTLVSDRTIALPRLKRLTVNSIFLSCSNVLRQLRFPSLKFLDLQFSQVDPRDFPSILPTLSDWDNAARSGQHPFITYFLCEYIGSGMLFSTFDPQEGDSFATAESALRVKLLNTFSTEVVRSVSKILSLQNLEVLRVISTVTLEEDRWLECFGHLPRLKTLSVFGNLQSEVLRALSSEMLTSTSALLELTSSVLYFPVLCELVIECWCMGSYFEQLKSCLQKRLKFQMGIQKLRLLASPGLSEAQITALEDTVPQLIQELELDTEESSVEGTASDYD